MKNRKLRFSVFHIQGNYQYVERYTSMKNKILTVFIVLILAAGVGMLSYPAISNLFHEMNQSNAISGYKESLEDLSKDKIRAMKEDAKEYNDKLIGTVVLTDPFDPQALNKLNSDYWNLLNPAQDGVMGYIDIPKIKVHQVVYHGTGEEELRKGVGHLENSSLPIGGNGTHSIISGHTGLPTAKIFTDLEEIKEGDLFYLHVLDEILAYKVDKIKVVEPSDTGDFVIDMKKDYVTLVTCTPYGVNSHRLLIRGERTKYIEPLIKESAQEDNRYIWVIWLGVVGGVCVFGGAAAIIRHRIKKKVR